MNLGIKDLEIIISQGVDIFVYRISFMCDYTGRRYLATGSEPSPEQCFDAAMVYLADVVREVVEQ